MTSIWVNLPYLILALSVLSYDLALLLLGELVRKLMEIVFFLFWTLKKMRYSSPNIKFTLLKCTVQWVLSIFTSF